MTIEQIPLSGVKKGWSKRQPFHFERYIGRRPEKPFIVLYFIMCYHYLSYIIK